MESRSIDYANQSPFAAADAVTPANAEPTPSSASAAEAMPVEAFKSGRRALAEHNMRVGGLWCVGGIVVTAVTYNIAASSPTGGHYFVAWGAILFGGLQFLKGLFQLMD